METLSLTEFFEVELSKVEESAEKGEGRKIYFGGPSEVTLELLAIAAKYDHLVHYPNVKPFKLHQEDAYYFRSGLTLRESFWREDLTAKAHEVYQTFRLDGLEPFKALQLAETLLAA